MPCTTAVTRAPVPFDVVNVEEAPRAPTACISTGHQASTTTSATATARGQRHRRQPPRRPSMPIDRAATRATRASAVTRPSFFDRPATNTMTTVAARFDRSPADWRPKAAAPTAASDQIGSA